MITVHLRCYEELNGHLPPERRKVRFALTVEPGATVGRILEDCAIPLKEVDLVLANGSPAAFSHPVQDGDTLSAYPVFEAFDISGVTPDARLLNRGRKLADAQQAEQKTPGATPHQGKPSAAIRRPLRDLRFVLDRHLGRLAKHLRMLGFDCLYLKRKEDGDPVDRSIQESRILLTRDKTLVKNKDLTHAYLVRAEQSQAQTIEVVHRFDLADSLRPFTLCLRCNVPVETLTAEEAETRLHKSTRNLYTEFRQCRHCGRLYWKGSHTQRMQHWIEEVQLAARRLREEG